MVLPSEAQGGSGRSGIGHESRDRSYVTLITGPQRLSDDIQVGHLGRNETMQYNRTSSSFSNRFGV